MRYGTAKERVASVEEWLALTPEELLKAWNNPDECIQYADVVSAGIQLYRSLGKHGLEALTRDIPEPFVAPGHLEASEQP